MNYLHCTYLKPSVTGVIILHLLMIPGMAFVTGGARILEQELHPYLVELNHSLLTVGSVFQYSLDYLLTDMVWDSTVSWLSLFLRHILLH
jgi:Ca2+/H+ antiporter